MLYCVKYMLIIVYQNLHMDGELTFKYRVSRLLTINEQN